MVDGPPPANDDFVVGDAVVVATDALNLRREPSTGGSVIAVLPTGADLTVTETATRADGYDWYGVRSARFGDGWCAAEFLASSSGPRLSVGDAVRVIDGALNLRSAAGTSAVVRVVLPDGAPLDVIGGPETGGSYTWWQVRSGDYGTGWVAGEFIEVR